MKVHMMPDGTMHSGATHTASSKPLTHAQMVKHMMEMNPGMSLPMASKKVAAEKMTMMKKMMKK